MAEYKTETKIAIAGALAAVALLISAVFVGAYYYNREVDLREAHKAQEDISMAQFDKFKKTVMEKAGVTKASTETQKELFEIIMNSKSKSDEKGALVSFVHEHNPNPDGALESINQQYNDLSVAIEGMRDQFYRAQMKSRDIEREHAKLVRGFFAGTFISMVGGDTTPLDTNIITSTATDEVFESGKDDEILDPFGTMEK